MDGGDDVVFGLLIGLVGPSAPVCADELWECVSGFLRDLRRVELFGEPIRWRSPAPGALFAVHAAAWTSGNPAMMRGANLVQRRWPHAPDRDRL